MTTLKALRSSLMTAEVNFPTDVKSQVASLKTAVDLKAGFDKMLDVLYLNVHNLVHGQSGPSIGSTPRYKR